MNKKTTIDSSEVAKFAQLSTQWWDPDGPLKTLHDINPPRLEFIEQYLDVNSVNVLDVGCGGGILSESLAMRGASVTGLDVEVETLKLARSHAQNNGLTINYVAKPIETFNSPVFQAITCMEMLEHVADPLLVMEHCSRLLRPDGYLFLSTINRTMKAYGAAIVGAEYILNLLPRQTHDYEKFIKPSELVAMARKSGFEAIGMSGLMYNPFTRHASLHPSVDVNYLLVCRKLFST